MKEGSYNVADQEDSSEMKKCLDANGENDVEKKRTSDSVNGGSKSNKKAGIFDECIQRFGSKKACLIVVLLCILLFVFFIIIIALAVRVGNLEKRTNPVHCASSECLRASAKIVGNWNTSFDPCDDFWKYSCGKWLHKNHLPDNKGSLGVLDLMEGKVRKHLRHLLDLVSHEATVRDPEWKAQRFYQTCMNVEAVEQTAGTFKNKINEVGGWTLLNNWSSQRWDRNNVIERLHVEFGATPFFKLNIEADDENPTSNIIKILPAGLGLPSPSYYFLNHENKYEKIYTTYMDDIARELGATVGDSSRFAVNVFNFEKRLAEVSPPPEFYRDPFTHNKRLSLKQLISLAPTIPWQSLLQKYFPNANIMELTEVIIFNEFYFRELSNILSSADNLAMHNYLNWQFTFTYAPHLSKSFREISNHFYQALEGLPNPSLMKEERWEYCLKVTSDYLGLALGSMYVKHYFVPDHAAEANQVEDEIKKTFFNHIDKIPWVEDSSTRTALKEKMENLLINPSYPEFIRNEEALSDYYVEFYVQSDFFENFKNGKYFLRKKMEMRLTSHSSQDGSWTIFPQDVRPVYHYNLNHLVIPAGMLQEPLFEPSTAPSVRFGSLGTHIASQMFKAYDDKGVFYQKLGNLGLLLTEQSAISYRNKLQCLKDRLQENSESEPGNVNLTVGEFVADVAAVKFAYQAYRNMDREYDLPGIGKNHDQVFFIAYAQSMCENIRAGKVNIWADYSTTSPHERRVVNVLKQLPEFSDAFSCSGYTKMRASSVCHVW